MMKIDQENDVLIQRAVIRSYYFVTFFFITFSLFILCIFHTMHPNPTHLTPPHIHLLVLQPPSHPKQNKTKFKIKREKRKKFKKEETRNLITEAAV